MFYFIVFYSKDLKVLKKWDLSGIGLKYICCEWLSSYSSPFQKLKKCKASPFVLCILPWQQQDELVLIPVLKLRYVVFKLVSVIGLRFLLLLFICLFVFLFCFFLKNNFFLSPWQNGCLFLCLFSYCYFTLFLLAVASGIQIWSKGTEFHFT